MSSKAIVGSIIGSIVGSVAVMTLLTMFVMPMFLPGMQSIVLQSIYVETSSQASIPDDLVIYQPVPDMEINITIKQNSRILATFSAEGSMTIDGSLVGSVNYYIAIVIEGIGNHTQRVHFYDGDGDTGIREFAVNLFDIYQTNILPAGTYSVTIYWKCGAPATGSNTLNLSTPAGNRTRGLLVQELI
ncbi:MAG: hypothetical protein ACFE85_03545 [Candidatus Hodarchaeota archaeon]